MKTLHVQTVWFTRSKTSTPEWGVIVNEGSGPIIDMDGKVVDAPVWDYRTHPQQVMTVFVPEDM